MAKRQSNGAGTYVSRKDGTIEYRVSAGIGMDGKPVKKSFYGKTKKTAREKYDEWKKDSGNVPIEKVKTVGEWAEKWLEIYKRDKVSWKSYKNYKLYVEKHITPHIGKLRLEQVRPAHIEELLQKKKDLSWSSRHHLYIALNGVFESAVENNFCSKNPVEKVALQSKPKRRPQAFHLDDTEKILAFASNDKNGALVCGLLHTGVREGELSALTWADLHLDEGYIDITKTVAEVEPDVDTVVKIGGVDKHRKQYAIKDTPKSDRDRKVVLSPQGIQFFKALPQKSIFVFPAPSGSYLTPNQFRWRYDQFFSALNTHLNSEKEEYIKSHSRATKDELAQFECVSRLSPHKCRHTYATRLLAATGNLRVVQEQLGHQQVSTTEIYADVEMENRKNNVVKLKY